jgi:hypothetical protein
MACPGDSRHLTYGARHKPNRDNPGQAFECLYSNDNL